MLNRDLEDARSKLETVKQQIQAKKKLEESSGQKEANIADLEKRLDGLSQQLVNQDKLKESIKRKDESLQTLQTKVAEIEQLKPALSVQKQACDEKDANIQQLNSELAISKEESQVLGRVYNIISQERPEMIQALMVDLNNSQPLGEPQEQARRQTTDLDELTPHAQLELGRDVNLSQESSNARDPNIGAAEPEQPPRRVADRSGRMKPPIKLHLRTPRLSQPQSSGSTNVVPNSQHETPDETLEFAERGNSSSPLSEFQSDHLPSDEDEAELETAVARPRVEVTIPSHPAASPARPSTAQTDLFKVHATGLNGSAARSAGRKKKNSSPDSLFDTEPAHAHPESDLPTTVAPRDLQLQPGTMFRRSHLDQMSPRRLRDGTPFGGSTQVNGRAATPMPEIQPNEPSTMSMTPATKRDKPQPNSAAKRSLEGEPGSGHGSDHTKRLKRTPENLAVRKPGPKPTPATPVRAPASAESRKGGSIMGTPAPAPGAKTKSKSTRKTSQKSKFDERFSAETRS